MMLSRGLPFSVLVHAIALVVMVMFGNHVARNPVRPTHSIKVNMVHLSQPEVAQNETPAEIVVQPEPQEEIKQELPPKELPKPKPVDPPKQETKPQEKIEAPEPQEKPAEAVEEVVAKPIVSGPSVAGTDTDFPFDWYLSRIDGLIKRNWDPRQHQFGKNSIISCAVHFQIARNGTVSQVTLIRNSGVGIFDRDALRAAQTTRMPPLPPQFPGASLGVTVNFNLEPGT
jgi:TonB family protein